MSTAEHSEAYIRGYDEALKVAAQVSKISQEPTTLPEDQTQKPLRAEQWRIILDVLSDTRPYLFVGGKLSDEGKSFLTQSLSEPKLQGLSPACLMMEYVTACLAREKALWERRAYRHGSIPFAISGAGAELAFISIERHARQSDPVHPYYRWEALDFYRGGTSGEQLAQTVGTLSDTHSGGRQLPGHAASDWRNERPVISMVGANILPAVGEGQGYELARKLNLINPEDRSVIFAYSGDAGMAQGEVKEAVDQLLMRPNATVLIVINNRGGISTSLREGSVGGDPLASCRGLVDYGLKIVEVDATNLQQLFDRSKEVVEYARMHRCPVLYHIYNVPKIAHHSTSDDMSRYKSPSQLEEMAAQDPLPLFREYLVSLNVASSEELDSLQVAAKAKIEQMGVKILAEEKDDPARLYKYVYSPEYEYGPRANVRGGDLNEGLPGELEHLGSTREQGVHYIGGLYRRDTFPVSMRQAINIALAEEMRKDPKIVVFGEDVADFPSDDFSRLEKYFGEKVEYYQEEHGDFFSEVALRKMDQALKLVSDGKGYEVSPEDFAALCAVLGGKGGVFKLTQFLQLLYGNGRVWNSTLAEASIVGLATGYALAGFTPVVEIQFDAYISPARQQLKDQAATVRWRSVNQYSVGVVYRVQGMSRLKGVGGIGHGEPPVGEIVNIPGIRTVLPAHADEAGPLLREAIRVAKERGENVVFLEPINQYNASKGYYQGPDAHIPIGEAEIRRQKRGDFVVLTWSNNLAVVEEAAKVWEEQGIHPVIVNLRTLGVQTDWDTVGRLVQQYSKVMIVEAERGEGSAGASLSGKIAEKLFYDLDAPILRLSGRAMRTSAGIANEAYQLPQVADVVQAGLRLRAE